MDVKNNPNAIAELFTPPLVIQPLFSYIAPIKLSNWQPNQPAIIEIEVQYIHVERTN